jgi:UDPglucose--hexose-1-phosphate uridylyltransferase
MAKSRIEKDFLIDRYSIIAEERSKRPHCFKKEEDEHCEDCFFCPGSENLTPPEICRWGAEDEWRIRCFENKFPAIFEPRGKHEIIVDTNKHEKTFAQLSAEDMLEAFLAYDSRRVALEKEYEYVTVFKNHGRWAGASVIHSHAQVIAIPMVPPLVQREVSAAKKYAKKNKSCAFCDYIKGKRSKVAARGKKSIAIAPDAPRVPYEVWMIPKEHVPNFSELSESAKTDLVGVVKKILGRLEKVMGNVSYNMYFHHAPKGVKDYHFHIELLPRIAKWAGFELSSGMYICTVSPENAAKIYRG